MGRDIDKQVFISLGLPEEKPKDIKFVLIAIDSDYKLHYEFDKRHEFLQPLTWYDFALFKVESHLFEKLRASSISAKTSIVGILKLRIVETKDYTYARINGLGVEKKSQGNQKILLGLFRCADEFCRYFKVKFLEAETRIIPAKIMIRYGFKETKCSPFTNLVSFSNWIFNFLYRKTSWVKQYN